ncbi:hypothetical protein K435DRAFT_862813 [Dendrothele bispora CBS 962.96]|uniref:Uncharacterized protein n=1 Tax=Dendrothele bispora (strain CBS 962.96) TaxID=1314807 RepID=A0A4V4HEQ9_DENBC|nr:hypothetical protein K435DRAFT_862813 [Dendrothele bispora CBS 962.96]
MDFEELALKGVGPFLDPTVLHPDLRDTKDKTPIPPYSSGQASLIELNLERFRSSDLRIHPTAAISKGHHIVFAATPCACDNAFSAPPAVQADNSQNPEFSSAIGSFPSLDLPSIFIPFAQMKATPNAWLSSLSLGFALLLSTSQVSAQTSTTSLYVPVTTATASGPPPSGTPMPLGPPVNTEPATAPNGTAYVLDSSFDINDDAVTRAYNWVIAGSGLVGLLVSARVSRMFMSFSDGYNRSYITINGQTPGPPIEANEGDTLVSTQYMDGVPGATQPLVVHSVDDPLVRGTDFDHEQVSMFYDWYRDEASTIVDEVSTVQVIEADGTPKRVTKFINLGSKSGIKRDNSLAVNGILFDDRDEQAFVKVNAGGTDGVGPVGGGWAVQERRVRFRSILFPLSRVYTHAEYYTGKISYNGEEYGRFFVNDTTYTNHIYHPVLLGVASDGTDYLATEENVTYAVFDDDVWSGDIIASTDQQLGEFDNVKHPVPDTNLDTRKDGALDHLPTVVFAFDLKQSAPANTYRALELEKNRLRPPLGAW